MKKLLALLFLLAAPAGASDANIVWGPAATADTYSVYLGVAPGVYATPVTGITTLSHTFPDNAMTQNVKNFVAVSASNQTGESGLSAEISGFPRPRITGTAVTQETGFIRIAIVGSNFEPSLTAANIDLPGMDIITVTRVSVNEIQVDYTLAPGTPNDPVGLTVSNEWIGAGFLKSISSEVFLVPEPGFNVPPAPLIMDIT